MKKFLLVCLAFWATNAMALPVVFTDSLFETSAVAIANGSADPQFGSGPPLPAISDAAVVGTDLAIASGLADNGLLVTSADVTGAGAVSAVGTSRFVGSFTGGGVLGFMIDFNPTDTADPGAVGEGTLSVLLTRNGVTVLDEIFTDPGVFDLTRFIAVGDYVLDVLLSSEASATGGSAQSLAIASFATPTLIPEPATWLLMLLGLLFLSAWSSRVTSRRAAFAAAHR